MDSRFTKPKPKPRYNPMNPGVPKPRKPRVRKDTTRYKKCFALGCHNKLSENGMKFFKLPKNETIRDIWIRFSRRGNEYEVKDNTYLCEAHFDPSCFLHKQKKTFLLKNSIPSIFIKNTPNGPERTTLTFDQSILHYVEEDTFLKPVNDHENHQKQNLEKCQQKLMEIRDLCRLCFSADCENLVELKNLKDYGVSIHEMLNFVGINSNQSELFSELACEECFQEIVGFDGFRKRCQKSQKDILNEINEIKQKMELYGGDLSTVFDIPERTQSKWKKEVAGGSFDDPTVKFMDDFISYDSPMPEKSVPSSSNIQHVTIKEEKKDDPVSDYEYEFLDNDVADSDDEFDNACTPDVSLKEEIAVDEEPITTVPAKKEKKKQLKTSDFDEAVQNDDTTVVMSKQVQVIANALYECYTCKKRFAGRKTFESHDCPVPLSCSFSDCGAIFKKMGGFVTHITKMHKMPRVQRKFCKVCKLSWVVTEEDFAEHSKKCTKEIEKTIDKSIECQICGKVCKNIKAYTVHQMFHDKDPSYPKSKEEMKLSKIGSFICENCGEEYKTKNQLSQHIRSKHTIAETNPDGTEKTVCEVCGRNCINSFRLKVHKSNVHGIGRKKARPVGIFTCDKCGQQRNSRLGIYDHIRRTHVDIPSPCFICGKVFRHPTLLKTHMKYHTTPMHQCLLCGEKAYATAQALRRHQESNHGLGPGYPCDYCPAIYKTRVTLSTHRWDVHGIKGPLRK